MDIKTARNASGITAAREIKESYPAVKIVMVTSIVDREVLQKSRTAGADSLWFKEAGRTQLLSVIRRTLAGEKVYPDSSPTVEIGTAKSCEFTSREMDVLRLLVKGYRNPQIAEELGLSAETVKSHINNMLQKTNCENKLQLVVAVTDAQLIIPNFKTNLSQCSGSCKNIL